MRTTHLTDGELDALLAGDELPVELTDHLESCLACRTRRERFFTTVVVAREAGVPRPAEGTTAARAVERWQRREGRGVSPLWRLAAGVVLALALFVLWDRTPREEPSAFDPDAVLAEVDETLARDPMESVLSEELVEWILTSAEPANEGSTL